MYLLESKDEFFRLEQQATQDLYSVKEELEKFDLSQCTSVLDAGCGAGACSDYLLTHYPKLSVYGCDLSEIRISQIKKKYPHLSQNFFVSTLQDLQDHQKKYDLVITRFVLQHISDYEAALESISKVLNPEGKIIIIEGDEMIFNITSNDIVLTSMLDKLKKEFKFHMNIGRELPPALKRLGFKDIEWDMSPMVFKNADIKKEIVNTEQRFSFIKNELVKIFGSSAKFEDFRNRYLSAIASSENVFFANKFIISAQID